jgi:DNA polymerase-4
MGEKSQTVRKVIHIDMDAFYASVEQRDDPSLRGKAIAVAGTPDQRGVVLTASYEARAFGVHSAMPSRTAFQRCPQLIFVRPNFEKYRQASDLIREIFFRYSDLVEPLSLDEAYLDVTENKVNNPSATLIAREIRQDIFSQTGLTASAGVSTNKFLAKTASGVQKPDGQFLIKPEDAEAFLEKLPIQKFYGIGKVTAERMRHLGLHTGADLKQWSEAELIKHFGKAGRFYYYIVRGVDDRPVEPNRVRKTVGAEESFAEDLKERQAIIDALADIAQTLKKRLDDHQASGRTLTLKVKYSDYQQVTRSRTLLEPLGDAEEILGLAIRLMESTEVVEKHARLLGLSVSNLDGEEEPDDFIQLMIDFNQ